MKTETIVKACSVAAAFFAGAALAQDAAVDDANAFIEKAIEGNIGEVQVGTLAEQRTSGDTQAFADALVTDHRNALEKSTAIAEQMNMSIPEQPPAKAQAEYAQLVEQSGESFDRHFVDMMVKNHEATIRKYRAFLESAEPGTPAAQYAERTLPVLEKHLETAKSLHGQSGDAGASQQ